MFVTDNCASCNEQIKSDTILAGPNHYHENCFVCQHCGVRSVNLELQKENHFGKNIILGWEVTSTVSTLRITALIIKM